MIPNISNLKHKDANNFFLLAGPCVVESEKNVFQIAEKIVEITDNLQIPFVFKASYRKANRSRLDSFTGIGDLEALNGKGSLLCDNLGRPDEANRIFDEAIRLAPNDPTFRYNKGNALYAMGNYTDAIKCWEDVIDMGGLPESMSQHKIGNALRMLHRNSEAEAAYIKARELGYSGPMTQMEMTTT